jgi:glycosyltransferase involved in cell wall biosynthesis
MLEKARSDAGKRLIENSFTEDKLVGDLMALAGIHPSNEDHDAHFQYRAFPGATPVSKFENTFYPSLCTPTKVVKFEDEVAFAAAKRHSRTTELAPKKIWPTYGSPSLKQNANQLELLTSPARATELLKTQQVVISVVRNEATILPHFLTHYRNLGVTCFVFIDNCSDDGSREYLIDQPDVLLYSSETEYKHSHYGVSWQQAVLGNLCLGKWALLVDADEFLIYEDCETVRLGEFLMEFEREGSDGALVYMIDMYPAGDLAEASFEKASPFESAPYFDANPLIEIKFGGGSFSNSRNFVSGLRHRIAPSRINAYVSHKYALFRYFPWVRLTEGIHYAANLRVTNRPVFLAHFKYHAEFKKKVMTEVRRNQHYNGAEEYRRYAAMLAKGSGSFIEEGTSQRYASSHSFMDWIKGHPSAS